MTAEPEPVKTSAADAPVHLDDALLDFHELEGEGFDLEERKALVAASVSHLPNVSITSFASLVVDLARDIGADFIVKGLRAVSDFESELQQGQMNLAISGVHTVFLPSATTHSFVASKLIREISRFGGDVSSMVPPPVNAKLGERFSR